MAQTSRTFRIFVSSTFSDLKAERNALQERVFPKLRELCMQHGCRFQAIDLRWGVSEEASLDQQTMKICMEEINRCRKVSPRPNFIVLLGDRYGWQPLPYEIPADEFEEIESLIADSDDKNLLSTWYRRDDNAVSPVYPVRNNTAPEISNGVYCLLPREGEYEDFTVWDKVEKQLLTILRRAVSKTNLNSEARLKYFSSATEQEIFKGAMTVPDAKDHVFCFLRSLRTMPEGLSAGEFIDLDENGVVDHDARNRLEALKESLREKLPGNVYEYEADWGNNSVTGDHLENLCKDVYEELSGIITKEIGELQEIDPLENEIGDHWAFAEERARHFTGRREIVDSVIAYLRDNVRHPLAIYGEGGSGKSALIAYLAQKVRDDMPDAIVLLRHIGATPESSDIRSLLENLLKQIASSYSADEASVPKEYKELLEEFPKKLALATPEKPLVIFLDALDQLLDAERARNLIWLPTELPEHVRIVVSALAEDESYKALKRKLSQENLILIDPMPETEGEKLLDLWLSEANRMLQPRQKNEVMSKFNQCGMPLYLKLAFEEARKWRSFDKTTALDSDINGIIGGLFTYLSLESNHGAVMVSRILGYLTASKNGLTEDEFLDLLSTDKEVMEDFKRRSPKSPVTERLPIVVWARLYFDLKSYLSERSADNTALILFFHRQFRNVVFEKYLPEDIKKERHKALAMYFGAQPYEIKGKDKKIPNFRKVSELPYQEMNGEIWEELERTLTDFDFPMTKCKALMVDGLLEDYRSTSALPALQNKTFKLWAAFFRERAHILRRGNEEWPSFKILLQLAVEHADESPITKAAEKYLEDGKVDWVWIRRMQRVKEVGIDPCIAVLEGHSDFVYGALELSDGRILSWSADTTLRLWDRDGKPISVFEKHSDRVRGALELSNGKILSWSGDNTLCIWDRDGSLVSVFEGHSSAVNGALELSDGNMLSWSADKTSHIWDKAGLLISVLEAHSSWVQDVLELSDGRVLSWSGDTTLRLWDQDGTPIAVLQGHSCGVMGAIELTDGRILSRSLDSTLRLWDIDGKPVSTLKGHTSVGDALELSSGRLLSWGTDTNSRDLRLWDRKGIPLSILDGHSSWVLRALELSTGRILSWAADKTLRLWDQDGTPISVLEGHSSNVSGTLELSDGRILSWARDEIRIWDKDGRNFSTLEGHTDWVRGALELSDGRILSWAADKTLRLWDRNGIQVLIFEGHSDGLMGALELSNRNILSWAETTIRLWDRYGHPIAIYSYEQAFKFFSELRVRFFGRRSVLSMSVLDSKKKRDHLSGNPFFAVRLFCTDDQYKFIWHGTHDCTDRFLKPSGRMVVTQANGQVCFLRLYHGNKQITIKELEEMHGIEYREDE